MSNNYILSSCLSVNFPNVDWRQDKLLAAPVLSLPDNNINLCEQIIGTNTLLCLTWFQVTDATHYLLQWCYNPDFKGPSLREQILVAPTNFYCLNFPADIRQGEEIYWRVQAANLTTGGVSEKSETRQFKYDCGGDNANTTTPTLCDKYSVRVTIDGPTDLKCCDQSTFSAEISAANFDVNSPYYILIKNVYWKAAYDGGSVSTAPQESSISDKAKIKQDSTNPAKMVLETNLDETQIIRITCDVEYTFPNRNLLTIPPELADDFTQEDLLPDFICQGATERFVECAIEGTNVSIPDKYLDSTVEFIKDAEGTELKSNQSYHITGPVHQKTAECGKKWSCASCDCEYGKVSVNGTLYEEVGDKHRFTYDCPTDNCEKVTEITLQSVTYQEDCTTYTASFLVREFEGNEDFTDTVQDVDFSCTCRCDEVVAADITFEGQAVDAGEVAVTITDCANCVATAEARATLIQLTNSEDNCTLSADFDINYVCNSLVVATDSITVEFDKCIFDQTVAYSHTFDVGDGTFCTFNGNFALTGQFSQDTLDLSCSQSLMVNSESGSYEANLNTGACDCLPQKVEVTFEVDSKKGFAIFELDDNDDYQITSQTKLVVESGDDSEEFTYSLGDLRLSGCDLTVITSEPDLYVVTLNVTNCDPFTADGTTTSPISGEEISFTVTSDSLCSNNAAPLVAKVNIPLDCTLDGSSGEIGVNLDNLTGGTKGYLKKQETETCTFISPRICECDNGVNYFQNTIHRGVAQEQILPLESGSVLLTGTNQTKTIENSTLSVIESGDDVLVFFTNSCETVMQPYCCNEGSCPLDQIYFSSSNPDITLSLSGSVDNGDGTITHTLTVECDTDSSSTTVNLTLKCNQLECKFEDLTGTSLGACSSIGVIYYGNNPNCASTDPPDVPDVSCLLAPGVLTEILEEMTGPTVPPPDFSYTASAGYTAGGSPYESGKFCLKYHDDPGSGVGTYTRGGAVLDSDDVFSEFENHTLVIETDYDITLVEPSRSTTWFINRHNFSFTGAVTGTMWYYYRVRPTVEGDLSSGLTYDGSYANMFLEITYPGPNPLDPAINEVISLGDITTVEFEAVFSPTNCYVNVNGDTVKAVSFSKSTACRSMSTSFVLSTFSTGGGDLQLSSALTAFGEHGKMCVDRVHIRQL